MASTFTPRVVFFNFAYEGRTTKKPCDSESSVATSDCKAIDHIQHSIWVNGFDNQNNWTTTKTVSSV